MLRNLHLRNLAVLSQASVEFGPGLNVLTGETGAGKSIVVDSLALLAGGRASAELIRTGADVLTVTGVYELGPGHPGRSALEAAGVAANEDEIVVRREVSRTGRNRVFINDEPVTLRLLAELAPGLLRIHGQREELGLVAPDMQREWLDRQGGKEAQRLLEHCAAELHVYQDLARRRDRLLGDDRVRLERLDLLRYQTGEIDAARLEPGEEVGLRQEREVLRHSEAIQYALGTALARLAEEDGSASEGTAQARTRLQEVEEWEPQAESWRGELEEIQIRIDELATTLRQRLSEVEADPHRLNEVEERLALIDRLCRKYGSTTEEILDQRQAMERELGELEVDESTLQEIQERTEQALEEYKKTVVELSSRRQAWASKLERRIERELGELALNKARFAVKLGHRATPDSPLRVDGKPVGFTSRGIDQVVFEFSPNPGEDLRPLAKVASGGELSRVYLALQVTARGKGQAAKASLVFDEVDAGVGGQEAAILGRKLKRLAQGGQILAVTHLPQVASHGDLHFRVAKQVRKGRTHVTVEELETEARVEEVARMLAGEEVTGLSRSHAQELIAGAEEGR